jgi:hypothetical protein
MIAANQQSICSGTGDASTKPPTPLRQSASGAAPGLAARQVKVGPLTVRAGSRQIVPTARVLQRVRHSLP